MTKKSYGVPPGHAPNRPWHVSGEITMSTLQTRPRDWFTPEFVLAMCEQVERLPSGKSEGAIVLPALWALGSCPSCLGHPEFFSNLLAYTAETCGHCQ